MITTKEAPLASSDPSAPLTRYYPAARQGRRGARGEEKLAGI